MGDVRLMNELQHNQKLKDNIFTSPTSLSRWSIIVASLIFSFSAYAMVSLYGIVHWRIMLNSGIPRDAILLEHVYPLLTILACLRFTFAILAVIYAGLSYVQGPKLAAVIASAFAGFAIMTVFIVM